MSNILQVASSDPVANAYPFGKNWKYDNYDGDGGDGDDGDDGDGNPVNWAENQLNSFASILKIQFSLWRLCETSAEGALSK